MLLSHPRIVGTDSVAPDAIATLAKRNHSWLSAVRAIYVMKAKETDLPDFRAYKKVVESTASRMYRRSNIIHIDIINRFYTFSTLHINTT